jgi:hypothetical protein
VASRIVRRNRTIAVGALVVLVTILIVSLASCGAGGSTKRSPLMPVGAPLPPYDPSLTDASVRTVPLVTVVDEQWVADTAEKTGIPARVLAAYAGGAVRMALTWPECGLTWNTLAGIGWVESHHGELFGDYIDDNGFMSVPIFGVPLVGDGTMNIPDFDDGNFDGTAEYDRAVGPMQIIPQTWAAWNVDGNGDGNPDGVIGAAEGCSGENVGAVGAQAFGAGADQYQYQKRQSALAQDPGPCVRGRWPGLGVAVFPHVDLFLFAMVSPCRAGLLHGFSKLGSG